jgi:hypothetical protein
VHSSPQNTTRSTLPRTTRFGDLRRRILSCWRRTTISACNAARDRNSAAMAHQMNAKSPPVGLTIKPIRKVTSAVEFPVETAIR